MNVFQEFATFFLTFINQTPYIFIYKCFFSHWIGPYRIFLFWIFGSCCWLHSDHNSVSNFIFCLSFLKLSRVPLICSFVNAVLELINVITSEMSESCTPKDYFFAFCISFFCSLRLCFTACSCASS